MAEIVKFPRAIPPDQQARDPLTMQVLSREIAAAHYFAGAIKACVYENAPPQLFLNQALAYLNEGKWPVPIDESVT